MRGPYDLRVICSLINILIAYIVLINCDSHLSEIRDQRGAYMLLKVIIYRLNIARFEFKRQRTFVNVNVYQERFQMAFSFRKLIQCTCEPPKKRIRNKEFAQASIDFECAKFIKWEGRKVKARVPAIFWKIV